MIGHRLSRDAIFVALAAECVLLSLRSDAFLTSGNLMNVLRQNVHEVSEIGRAHV